MLNINSLVDFSITKYSNKHVITATNEDGRKETFESIKSKNG